MNVLILSPSFIPSVILCGHAQMEYLSNKNQLNYRFAIPYFLTNKDVSWADIVIFIRSDSSIDAYVSKICNNAGKHCVYVLDDDLLNVPLKFSSAPHYALSSTKKNIIETMKYCDTLLTTSPNLLAKYKKYFNNTFLIDEPSINRLAFKETNTKVKIGFAGSIDRKGDISDILTSVIYRIKEQYQDDIVIEFMGAKPDFVDELKLNYLPYQDSYDAYTSSMARANWDIGLAPIADSEFHACKYFNKYVEYASFGIAGIYSNLKPYTRIIKDKENGLLVDNNPEAWYEALVKLIEDTKLRKQISANCIKQASDQFNLDRIANDYLNKISYAYSAKDDYGPIPSIEIQKLIDRFSRIIDKVKQEKWGFPVWFIEKVNKKIEIFADKLKSDKYYKKIIPNIDSKKTYCVFGSYDKNCKDKYHQRVNYIDQTYLKDSFKVYLDGSDRLAHFSKIEYIDEDHACISFNSFNIKQAQMILSLIEKCHNLLIHEVTSFKKGTLSDEMYEVFNMKDVHIVLDTHGNIPEFAHETKNYYLEDIASNLELMFFNNVEEVLVDNIKSREIFEKKYGKKGPKIKIVG